MDRLRIELGHNDSLVCPSIRSITETDPARNNRGSFVSSRNQAEPMVPAIANSIPSPRALCIQEKIEGRIA